MLSFLKSKNVIYPLVLVIVAIALISSFYFYSKYQQAQKLLNNPNQASKEEIQTLLGKVGSLIMLPSNEAPTVATVSDKKKLTDQPFFKNAENGDKVLLYSQAQKAILYRPSANKIIEVAPINLNTLNTQQPVNQSAKGVSPTPIAVKVLILNGTTRVGLTNVAEIKLKEEMASIQVVDKDNANKNTYDKTLVSYISDSQKAAATQIASILGGEVVSLPAGEQKTNDIIVIILGKDFAGTPSTPTPDPTVKP